jgi:DNA-binding NarL/FixJ family response regulator
MSRGGGANHNAMVPYVAEYKTCGRCGLKFQGILCVVCELAKSKSVKLRGEKLISNIRANHKRRSAPGKPLTPFEAKIADMVGAGMRYKDIANKIGSTYDMTRISAYNIIHKSGCSNRIEYSLKWQRERLQSDKL